MMKANAVAIFVIAVSAFAADPYQSVDAMLGQQGKVVAGDVHRYSWPRRDLNVTIGGVRVER